MKFIILFISFLFISCNNNSKTNAPHFLDAGIILGNLPSKNLEIKTLNSVNAEISFNCNINEFLAWAYSWPIISKNYSNTSYDEFNIDSKKIIYGKKYLIFDNYEINYKINGVDCLYGVKCTTMHLNINEVACTIAITKLE